jgi:hypothetical protein
MQEIVRINDVIAAPIGEVWAIVSSFNAVKSWMPELETCSCVGVGVVGDIRRVRLKGAPHFVEERCESIDPQNHAVSYRILDREKSRMKGYVGSITLTANGADSTKLEWIGQVDHLVDLTRADVAPGIEKFYHSCLGGLKAILKKA